MLEEIETEGGIAKAYKANVLDKESLTAVHEAVVKDLGTCDILINGAGGNNPRATTDKEYYEKGDIDADTISFFDLDPSGVEFVFKPELHRNTASDPDLRAGYGGQGGMQHLK